jgi:isochorismate pyruvate lyase
MLEPEQCETMTEVRAALDLLDAEIVTLLARRFRYIDAAARIKQRRDQVRDEERISAVIDHVRSKAAAQGAPAELIAELYTHLIEVSIERELRKFDGRAVE